MLVLTSYSDARADRRRPRRRRGRLPAQGRRARGRAARHPGRRPAASRRSTRGRPASCSAPARTSVAAADLTPRESEVLALVRQGLANKQIARRLGITERTVKAHLTSVFQRIGVVDRTQAALWAERNGCG